MIGILVLCILLTLLCLIGMVSAFRDSDIGPGIWLLVMAAICGLLSGVVIDSMCKGNEELVEYRFPADHYKFETEVTVSHRTVYLEGEEVIAEDRDTTYILTGIEPIVLHDNHYKRHVLK